MPQDISKPADDGKISLPPVDDSMIKRNPQDTAPVKNSRGKEDEDKKASKKEKKKAEEEEQKILALARKRFQRCISAESKNRAAAVEDLKFKAGDQWPADIKSQRSNDKRPCLTINKIPSLTHQVTNDLRQNRPAINVSPVGDKSDKEGARAFAGMINAIERDCAADIAYDTAICSAADIGFGYVRVLTDYEKSTSFNRVIIIKRVRNPFTVYLDPERQEPDGCDSRFGFITEMMDRGEFKDKYPGKDQCAWTEKGVGDELKEWITKDNIRIAEYFTMEHDMKRLVMLDNGHVGFYDDLAPEVKKQIEDGELNIEDEREAECQRVVWHKITALQILDTEKWPGRWIPIVEFLGEEIDIQGEVIRSGLIRNAKDPQRMKNYWAELSLDTKIPTPSGWTTMGDIQVGDKLFDEFGNVCSVLGFSPIHDDHKCYRLEFDDGAEIIADENHLWTVEERGKRMSDGWQWEVKTLSTKDLDIEKHVIVVTKPLELPNADLPIHPYLLGHWLGDGSSEGVQLTPGDEDIEEVQNLLSGFGLDVGEARFYGDKCGVFTVHGERSKFTELNLLNNKHIPQIYLRASREQRMQLLQGLMDSDGSIAKSNRQCSFTTVTKSIAEGFAELLRTLGIKAISVIRLRGLCVMPNGKVSDRQPAWQFSFTTGVEDQVFRLQRKLSVLNSLVSTPQRRTKRHRIISITPTDSVPVRCLAVDSPNNLFLAGESMIPTHNTAKTELVALAPKAPYIMAEGQDEGYESEWKQANTKSYPVLHYVPVALGDKPVPPPQRAEPPGMSQGIVEAEKSAEQDMLATTGVRIDPTINEFRRDESGKQLQEHRRNNDLGSYHYMDNASRSLRHIGRMLVDLIPKIYDTRRVVTILQEDDTEERITIDPTAGKPFERQQVPGGQQPGVPLPPGAPQPVENPARKLFNPGMGEYGVTVTIGPSYATKRIEASDQMMNFAKALPEKGALIAHLIAKYSDWPGSDECYRILAKALPPNLLTPDIRDLPPQMQAFVQSLQSQVAQLMSERMMMLKDLTSTKEDRVIKQNKIDKDFEAKMLKLMADMKTKSMEMDHNMIQTSMALNDSFHSRLQSQQEQQTQQQLPVSTVNLPKF